MRKFLKNKKKKSVMFLDYEKNRKKIPAFRCKRPWHKICLIMKRGNDIPEFPSGRRRAPDGKRGGNDHEMSLAGRGPSRSCRMQPAHSGGAAGRICFDAEQARGCSPVPCLGRAARPAAAADSRPKDLQGILFVILSAVIFGCIPVITKTIYASGGNAVSAAAIRNFPHCPPSVGFSAA